MTIAHLLEDFSASDETQGPAMLMSEDAIEDQRLTAFEQGYSAGWDDAIAARTQSQAQISEALAARLRDLSLTFLEVHSQLLGSLEPIFRNLIEAVLPLTMRQTLGQQITAQLCAIAETRLSHPVRLVVPEGAGAALKPILAHHTAMPIDLREDADLEEGMALLQVGDTEHELDSTRMLDSVRDSIEAFLYQSRKEVPNG